MTAAETGLQELQREHPEWGAWLAVVQVILDAIGDSNWDAMVPPLVQHPGKLPLLAAAKITSPANVLRPLVTQLIRVAARSGSETMASLSAIDVKQLDVSAVFKTALHHDGDALKRIASNLCVHPEAFESVATLVPMPFLQACNRAWETAVGSGWNEIYCPICGAWPTFAEVRGIERTRYLRCGRCGAGWQAHGLSCPYCGVTDHNELVSLVPENSALNAVIDACKRCLGYVKTFSKLVGTAPARVIVDDLASVALDIAAAENGYKRPGGTGYLLNISVA